MSKNYKILVEHILESIKCIEGYTKNVSEDDFMKSAQTQDSVIRRLEIIGEAIGSFPDEIKKEYSDIRWNNRRLEKV
ncbi:MAG: HepT-like ribonuclease domain-containing protein [Patescibacteria group bacterium]|nr:HepT-like ribonuclease domain-containing protein [Patescibacteria group bacterium]